MFASKKGIGIDDALPLLIILVIVALFVGCSKFLEKSGQQEKINLIQEQKSVVEVHDALMEYLKQIDDQGVNRAEQISKNYVEKNIESIKQDMLLYFNPKFTHIPLWRIELYDSSNNELAGFPLQAGAETSAYTASKIIQAASVYVPTNSPRSSYLRIRVFIGVTP